MGDLADAECKKEEFRKEELRGIFALGLLAVLVSFRYAQGHDTIMFNFGAGSFDLVPMLDITIALWSLYAFFMVIGLSVDELPKSITEAFRSTSKAFFVNKLHTIGIFWFCRP